MSDTQPPPPSEPKPNPDEVPLGDIDRLLEAEDPEFAKSLDEVRAVDNAKDVTIEASAIDESLDGQDLAAVAEGKAQNRVARLRARSRHAWQGFRARLKARLVLSGKNLIVFLKTRPKEYFFFALAMSKILLNKSTVPIKAFREATNTQRLTALILVVCALTIVAVLLANFKGVWLPQLNEPMLRGFEPFADSVETYDTKDEGESFYSAFPQERHEFLFPKIKVNLRRTADNPNPMGAFEVIVLLDSKDTAIEVRDREVEFFDQLQRVLEEESFTDLESELGKSRLKSRLKREMNQKLTQGWAKDISFKTFILKP